ncbi:MAG: hypothetical protein WC584_01545 [Candidatus Pacearchaeota archaeon]
MKRGIIFFLIVFLLIISSINFSSGAGITGKATSQGVGMNITVTASLNLSIISPKNQIYLDNNSILLNYSVSGQQAVWYYITNSPMHQNNITISSSIYFQTPQGNHTLYLYANNSQQTITKNVTFSVNSTYFTISYNNYTGSYKGSSTNFTQYSYEEMQNISNLILEHMSFGKIYFNQLINLTNDLNPSDYMIDIDSYTNFSFNRIDINITALPNFNKSATLSISDLTFTDPRILINNIVCPSNICVKQSYSSGTLVFNVTGFSTYSSEETPTSSGGGSTGGGGGSGSAIATSKTININLNNLKASIKQGEIISEELTIKNTGTEKIKLTINSESVTDFLKISESTIELSPGESKIVKIDIFARKDTKPNLYLGKLLIKGDAEKEILVAIEVESLNPLFDVNVEIPQRFLFVDPGEEIIANIKLFNLGGIGRIDVNVEYEIKDSEGNEIYKSTETLAVETQSSLSKIFQIPENTPNGDYVLYVKTTTPDGDIASATAWFAVGKIVLTKTQLTIFGVLVILIIVAIIIIFEIRKIKKYLKIHKKIDEKDIFKKIKKHIT